MFISGLQFNAHFYEEAVRPLLDAHFPNLPYAAGRLDGGSEVLGFDTEMSTDHDWGPRLHLFLPDAVWQEQATLIWQMLAESLPRSFRGYSTHYAPPNQEGTYILEEPAPNAPIHHRVVVTTVSQFVQQYLGLSHLQLDALDWLTIPQQRLATIARGAVYYDGVGEITAVRQTLATYPHDVWLYLMAMQWNRISQEEHLMGRAGSVGDLLGAKLIGARLVQDLMMLCFLQERVYAPYAKWFGSAFKQLNSAQALQPLLKEALLAQSWSAQESALCQAYTLVAEQHNALQVTLPLDTSIRWFFERPFRVLFAGRFTSALKAVIQDAQLQAIPIDVGSIDQLSDNTDLREQVAHQRKLRRLYED